MSSEPEIWQSSPRHEQPDEVVRWRHVAKSDQVGLRLGLSDAGNWVVVGPSSATELQAGAHPLFLFPLLVMSRSEAMATLEAGLAAIGADTRVLDLFPEESLVIAALESQADHWTTKALEWAADMPLSTRLATALERLTEAGRTQSIRHTARRITTQAEVR